MPRLFMLIVLWGAVATAQMPVPAPPAVFMDTSWKPPAGGRSWPAHTAAQLSDALDQSDPGDTIVLDAGTTYTGNFTVPAKENPKNAWIYIQSSELTKLPSPGTRVNPATDAANMPKIVTPNVSPAITFAAGSNHVRLAGLEITTASTQGCNLQNVPPIPCYTHELVDTPYVAKQMLPIPDSITIDRCYLHGSDTQDVRRAVAANASNFAVIDSFLSDNHQSLSDSQAILAYWTPGPIKIVNNYLSATTEDVMLGGAGGTNNPYVPSDIEIRHNHFYKPLSWMAPGITLPPHNKWVVKNNLEFKSARRAVVTGNIFENSWVSGQTGFSTVLTVVTSQSGNNAVVNDIDYENNIITGADAGLQSTENDAQCGTPNYPNCTSRGEARRWKIANNLIVLSPRANGAHHLGWSVAINMTDVVFQHNTVIMADHSVCWNSLFFNQAPRWGWPPPQSFTHNVWVLDNVLCRQPSGDSGGQKGLPYYMAEPPPFASRFTGNVMFVSVADTAQSVPKKNSLTVKLRFADPAAGNFDLASPKWTQTTDELPAGVDMNALNQAIAGTMSGMPRGTNAASKHEDAASKHEDKVPKHEDATPKREGNAQSPQ